MRHAITLRGVITFLCLSVAFVSLSDPLRAEIPGQKDLTGDTDAKYREQLLKLNIKTTIEAYAQVGKRNPAWDDKAVAFLEAIANELTYGACTHFTDYPKPPAKPAFVALGKAAVDAGCEDPLVLYFYIRALTWCHSAEPLEPYYVKMVPAMLASKYPPIRISRAISQAAADLKNSKNTHLRDDCIKAVPALLDAALSQKAIDDLGPIGPRFGVEFMDRPQDAWSELESFNRLLDFADRGLKNGAHPYIMKCLAAKAYIGLSEGMNGNRLAEANKNFADARRVLGEAWKEYPRFPNAPALAIYAVADQLDHKQSDAREWFDRATAIQFDYEVAYDNYAWSLTPGCQGSIELMIAFADECRQTERYDTFVPYHYVKIAGDISWLREEPGFPSLNDVDANLQTVLETYATTYHQRYRINDLLSHQCAIAAAGKKYDVVCTFADKLGADIVPAHFTRKGLLVRHEILLARALTSSFADKITQADAAADAQFEKGLEQFTALLATIPANDKSRPYVLSRIAALKAQFDFLAGDWVDIQPDADLAGWSPQEGKWSVDKDGGLIGENTADGLEIFHLARFGRCFTLTGNIEFLHPIDVPEYPQHAGPVLMGAPASPRYSILFYKQPAQISVGGYRESGQSPVSRRSYTAPTTGHDEFSIDVWNNYAIITINGRVVAAKAPLGDKIPEDSTMIGLGTNIWADGAGSSYRFTKLKIHLLEKEPAAPAKKKP